MSITILSLYEKKLITVNILYFRPDYNHILQDFTWQVEDLVPKLPRVHLFLKYWKENIEAVISEVSIMEENRMREWRKLDHEGIMN